MKVPGHVFVVHGQIGKISCDAVIIPTDWTFNVTESWQDVVGVDPQIHRPDDWAHGAVGASAEQVHIFFVDVAALAGDGSEWLRNQAKRVFALAADAGLTPGRGRIKPLVCVPVLGIGRGGAGHRTGEVILELLREAGLAAEAGAIDIAIVTPERSTFAAVQHQRRSQMPIELANADAIRLGTPPSAES